MNVWLYGWQIPGDGGGGGASKWEVIDASSKEESMVRFGELGCSSHSIKDECCSCNGFPNWRALFVVQSTPFSSPSLRINASL